MVSHTNTGEWQSFEVRMRRRRAERLALRAEIAAEAGCVDDARECLAEARALVPALPGVKAAEAAIAEAEERLAAGADSPANEGTPGSVSRGRWIPYTAAATLALVVLTGWTWSSGARSLAPDVRSSTVPSAETEPAAVEPDLGNPTAVAPQIRQAVLATSARVEASDPRRAADESRLAPVGPLVNDARDRERVTVEAPRPNEPVALPTVGMIPVSAERPAPPPSVGESPLSSASSAPGAPVAASIASLPAPAPAAEPPPAEPSPDAGVRNVLGRYASAYNALDVTAATRVWPGVNRGALTRAFDSLASQQVSLGDCRIDVSGVKAQARCAGRATWTPKIGSGTRTESRSWTFELARAGNDWQIVSARVQNR